MTLTALICTTFIIALGIYDLVVVTFSPNDVRLSISRWLQGLRKYPFIVFVFGWIGGHAFGYMTPDCEAESKKPLKPVAEMRAEKTVY